MALFHCILEYESESPLFLGKIALQASSEGAQRETYTGSTEVIGADGTVPAPWEPDGRDTVELPPTVETDDPFQIAPMASFHERPFPSLADTLSGEPKTVHVFETDNAEAEEDVDGVKYREEVSESSAGEAGNIRRWYEWDDDRVRPSVVADAPPAFGETSYLVGLTDEQDMHDPYTHLGKSATDTAPGALRDALTRLSGIPLWGVKAYPVSEHESFSANDVLALNRPAKA